MILSPIFAIAAMAANWASSAMATSTVLCSENILVRPASKKLEHVHIEGLAVNTEVSGKFFGITGTIKCEHSVFLASIIISHPLIIHIGLLHLTGNCHLLAPFVNEPCSEIKAERLAYSSC
jgi:hypothetical protein